MNQTELRARLTYDPDTGVFRYRKTASRKFRAGDVAGGLMNKGYVSIHLDGKRYLAHRLAWLYETGAWPVGQLDHIDRNRANNRWGNLREASVCENRRNREAKGFRAVGTKFQARIWRDGKLHSLGYFYTAQEAQACFLRAAESLHGAAFAYAAG